MKHKKSVAHLEEIKINNSSQWVFVRGKNVDAPLLIHVQAGPGLPMISEANEMEKICTWKIVSWLPIGINVVVVSLSAKIFLRKLLN